MKILSNFCLYCFISGFISFKEESILLNLNSILLNIDSIIFLKEAMSVISLISFSSLLLILLIFIEILLFFNKLNCFLFQFFFGNQMRNSLVFFLFLIDLILACFSLFLLYKSIKEFNIYIVI